MAVSLLPHVFSQVLQANSFFFAARDLAHVTGYAEADGWAANVADNDANALLYGPYTDAIPRGAWVATFHLMIDNNHANGDKVVTCDVNNFSAGNRIASRDIFRTDFPVEYQYAEVDVPFFAPGGSNKLEFRVWWLDKAYIRAKGVTVHKGGKTFQARSGKLVLSVPARGVGGGSPSRDMTSELTVNGEDYELLIPYYKYYKERTNRMRISRREFSPMRSPNLLGATFYWKMRNQHTTPVLGRTASIEWSLLFRRKYEEEIPTFSPTYTSVRQRFLEYFFFDGIVANAAVVENGSLKHLAFADTSINIGQAMIAFTSEYAIRDLNNDQEGRNNSVDIIKMMMGTVRNLLKNGYLERDDVKEKDLRVTSRHGNDVTLESDFIKRNVRNNEASIDQMIGVMTGLYAVQYHFKNTPHNQMVEDARSMINEMFHYLLRNDFTVKRPDGVKVKRGSDASGLSTLLHGIYKGATGKDDFHNIKDGKNIATVWDRGGILSELLVILRNLGVDIKTYSVHMALMLLCSDMVWTQPQLERSGNHKHHLSSLLYVWYHPPDSAPLMTPWSSISTQLEATTTGPARDEPFWNRDNIWVRGGTPAEKSSQNEWYNGVDYMLLHNLGKLAYGKSGFLSQRGGTARDVAVGANGDVWLVDNDAIPDSDANGGMIRRNTGGNTWDDLRTGIRAVRIAVAPDGTVWMVNGKGEVYSMKKDSSGSGDDVQVRGGTARDIAVGANGDVWLVDNDAIPDSDANGGMIRRNTGGNTWDDLRTGIRAVRIAVAPDGTVWMVNGKGEVYSMKKDSSGSGDDVQVRGGTARDIAVGANGDVWLVDNDAIPDSDANGGMIRRNTGGNTWDDLRTGIRAVRIAVAPDGTVWMVNGKGEVYSMSK